MGKTVFTDGDKSMGIPGTRVLAAFLNKLFSHRHDGLDADGSAPLNYAVAASADGIAYTAAFTPALTAHIEGMPLHVKFPVANVDTAPTFDPNDIGAALIQRKNGVALDIGDIPAGYIGIIVYNGSSYDLLNPYLGYVPGDVVQTVLVTAGGVATTNQVIPLDDTIPQSGEGTQMLAATITPTNAANKLLVEVLNQVSSDNSSTQVIAALFKDTEADARAVSCVSVAADMDTIPLQYEMAAGGTAAITFKVRVGPEFAATVTYNGTGGTRRFGGTMNSYLKITEIKQ